MRDIKIKDTKKQTIKILNKNIIGKQKIKNTIISSKNRILQNAEKENKEDGNNYAVNKTSKLIKKTPNNVNKIRNVNKYGKQKLIETQKNIKLAKKISIKNKTTISNNKIIIKKPKTYEQSSKAVINKSAKISKQSTRKVREFTIKTARETKETIKTAIVSLKAIATGTKTLIIAMLAGGWILVVIIIIICLIAMLISGVVNGQIVGTIDENSERTIKSAIYGTNESTDIVQVALSQIGNVGGEPYWSWYGFSSRVEWCAIFVSWCANECGYIEKGIIPKFASCENEGVKWFKEHGLWQEKNYIAKAGDIIFFDWKEKHDGHSDHVGIVEKVENGRVYTIEGNSNDSCKQRNYDINSEEIEGYGTPNY